MNTAHQGEQLQEAIKQSGIPISKLVQDLGITRPTIYRKFREETLDATFVKRVHEVLNSYVTNDTPLALTPVTPVSVSPTHSRVTTPPSTSEDYAKELIILQQKHIRLLEDYQALLTKLYTGR